MEQIRGIVNRIIFASDDGAFSVFSMTEENRRGNTSVTIKAPAPVEGATICLEGEWTEHPRFGHQFKAEKIIEEAPTDLKGVEAFLSSGRIAGIGKTMATQLTKHFGESVLDILEKDYTRLYELKGIGKKTAKKMHESYMKEEEKRNLIIWFQNHNISLTFVNRIFEKYGSFAVNKIEQNPYILAYDIDGIGFIKADNIAMNLGIDKDSPYRISAGIEYQLTKFSLDGHCCAPYDYLLKETEKLLGIKTEYIEDELRESLRGKRLCCEDIGETILIYKRFLYDMEVGVADKLLRLQKRAEILDIRDSAKRVAKWEKNTSIKLAERQRQAIQGALENGIFIMTGGPGTGKTTIVRGMIDILEAEGLSIILGAPTGRATKRLSEATGREAMTIHRMLECHGVAVFERNENNPLEADIIILDEVSMIDIVLMHRFLEAVEIGTHVIMVGDVDQLPSVGPGSVLKDMLRSAQIPQVRLKEVFRQENATDIVQNAHAINAGRLPQYRENGGFDFITCEDPQQVEDMIVELCCSLMQDENVCFDDVQVLSPMHRGVCGVEILNSRLQDTLNPLKKGGKERKVGMVHSFRVGDKVIQMKNNYEKEIFNGDIGIVEEILKNGNVRVRYGEDQCVEYDGAMIMDLSLAYCLSVHKSQGSEYKTVIMPLVPGQFIMLQRNLLYTAVTRAKKQVFLIGAQAALNTAVTNDRTKRRYSLLAERLGRVL